MNAGKAVYGILSANSGVTDIVGTRIFPEIAEQEAVTPFIVYQLLSVDPEDTHDGPSKLDEVRFEFLCYADSYNAAADLGVAVRAALDRVSGTYNGVHVESVQFNDVDVEIEYDPRRYSQVLKFTFRIKRDDVTIALGTPVTGAVLGDLSDVDVTGVTNGQLIAYNNGVWEAADDAGGAEELDDLTDVKIVGTPSEGDALVYQSGFFQLGQAGATTLGDLSDVNTTGAAAGSLISYNGVDGWEISAGELPSDQVYYHNRYASEAETLLDGATETVELYYTAQADGDGLHEDAQSDTATTGYDIRRKLYYAEKAQADPNTSGDWTQFADIADDTTYASAKATLLAYLKARTGGTVPISLKMTWEEVAEAPAFTGLLNESYGSGAEAAYSTRRLNGNVTECMVIRRASDSTTQTIGFDGSGNIDESAIETFCTGTTCTVVTWKDQSGNGNDATAPSTTEEPTIYTGGALVKENGRVALDFDGSSDYLQNAGNLAYTSGLSLYMTYNLDARAGAGRIFSDDITGVQGYFILFDSGLTQFNDNDTGFNSFTESTSAGNQVLHSINFNGNTGGYGVAFDGNNTTGTIASWTGPINSTNTANIGIMASGNGAQFGDGKLQEIIAYPSDKSSDRTDIESNIGDYFTQNTPLLDTYTGAAAAYSLRKLRSAYSGSAIRVRRASDNTESDIGWNVFGELDTVSLASFCSGTNGFVKTWYDQSGNANDATQTTTANQPKIYDSTTGVVTDNGKPAALFSGDYLNSGTVSATGTATNFAVAHVDGASGTQAIFYTPEIFNYRRTSDFSFLTQSSQVTYASTNLDDRNLHYFGANGSQGFGAINGGAITTNAEAAGSGAKIAIGTQSTNAVPFYGYIQECIYYSSDKSTDRTNIESNINTFYSIY